MTNSTSALAQAQSGDSPLFVIGGRAPQARWGMGSLQEMDHVELVRSLTKRSVTLAEADAAYGLAADCMRTALSARTGPVFMDIPLDVFFGAADLPEATEHLTPDLGASPDPDLIARAARLIAGAHRPAVIAGGSVWWAHAEDELKELVETAHLPLTVNGMARGALPPGHPLFFPRARGPALGEADLIVVDRRAAGLPAEFRPAAGFRRGRAPGLHRRRRPPQASRRRGLDLRRPQGCARARWPNAVAWRRRAPRMARQARARPRPPRAGATRRWLRSDSSPVHPARLIAEVDRFSDPDAIVVGDGGDFVSFAGRLIERPKPGLWIDPGPFGCLGSGPGYAMAAKLAHPDRQVVLLSGDGAFGFSAMEFDTMVRHRIPVVCVVGNNGIWALEKHPMQSMLGTSIAADLGHRTRYDKVVESLGGHGEMVDRPDEIRPALERAFRSGLPACINVICDPGAEYPRSSVLM